MRLLNCDEMKQVEKYTAKYGLSYQRMMENAGAACTRNIRNIIESEKTRRRNIVVVCGKGNNGGDGFVVARKFAENGYNVCIVLASGYPSSPEAEYMYKMALDIAIPTVWYDADKTKALQAIKTADVVVDAVFGFSFYGSIAEEMRPLINGMSQSNGLKFAIDVPSGVYCDSGYCDPNCFFADYTIAISALKPAHIVHPAADRCGDIIIANIGIPEDSYSFVESSMYTYNKTEVGNLFPYREPCSNKGTFGHLLSICGSRAMPGAAVLAASAALRSGAGLVTCAFPDCIYNTMTAKLTETLFMPLKSGESGTFSAECIPQLLSSLDKFDAILIGCGLCVNKDTELLLKAVLDNAKVPVIVDADALNIIAADLSLLSNVKAPIVVTPHPGEMSRLNGVQTNLIQADRVAYAADFSKKHGVYTVLKGANTVIASPEDGKVYVNASGNNGLSKGGSGDVLAGMLASLCASGMNIRNACDAAVYIHGYCADVLSERFSKIGMLPSDIVFELREVFAEFE